MTTLASPSTGNALRETLLGKIESRDLLVGVIGLGYVGVPMALAVMRAGFRVLGFDVLDGRVADLNAGRSPIKHIADASVAEAVKAGRFSATADFGRIKEPDAILICVPTPLTQHREPDLSMVVETARSIASGLRPGQLIVLESTTYPGTSSEVLRPILERTGLKSGRDFYLAYSPEREDPGNPQYETSGIPKVVGGDGPDALAVASALYGCVVVSTVEVSNLATAEAVKLTENIFRSVNIALVNELKIIYREMGVDIWEVVEAAKTKPFGFMPFYPGPGLGGHCIPIDPFYLTWKARQYGISTRFIELAGEINTAMPERVVERLARTLDGRFSRGLNGASILILGLAYKKNVDDLRESPALRLIELIEGRGARTEYHDPYIPVIPTTREHAALAGRRSIELRAAVVEGYDAVLVATDHDSVDYGSVVRSAKLVIDTRNACGRSGALFENVVKA